MAGAEAGMREMEVTTEVEEGIKKERCAPFESLVHDAKSGLVNEGHKMNNLLLGKYFWRWHWYHPLQ
jgi:hypothetical protein